MNSVRLGIVGMGNIGRYHADYLSKGKVNRAELTAVCDAYAALDQYTPLKRFKDPEELIRSGLVDAVLIATPHYDHTTIGIDAFQQGLHVLTEKPISVHKADCERLIAAHEASDGRIFSAMFQMRTSNLYKKVKKLIDSGEIGEISRVAWIVSDWFRTEAYYASGGWRASWSGEGGGVLLNQCPHNLDLMQWFFGMPSKVRAFCKFGAKHDIEVEDEVTAYLEYPNGATGVFITTTGEAPGTNRLEIAGSRGRIVLENNRLSFTRNEADMFVFNRTSKVGFAKPEVWNVDIPFSDAHVPHAIILQNFVNAVLDGEPLIAPGADGLSSVELANAMLYSSILGQTLELPMDSAAYERALQQLIAESKFEKKVVTVTTEDFSRSFNR
jgi:predicted dehydrogenase